MGGWAIALAALLVAGCTCSHEAPAAAPPSGDEPAGAQRTEWPEPALDDLAERPPATRVTVTPDRVVVDNAALVGTWPAAAVERARAEGDSHHPRWPVLHAVTPSTADPALREALADARRAERSATGAGSGAAVVDLRVSEAVRFEDYERLLLEVSRAGYRAPRVLLGRERLVAFDWPRARPTVAPSQQQIRDAMRALAAGDEPDLSAGGSADARLVMADRALRRGDAALCEDVTPATVARCLNEHDVERVTLDVEASAPFGRVLPWVQRLSVVDSVTVRVRSTR